MNSDGNFRSLLALAALGLSARELTELHKMLVGMSPRDFIASIEAIKRDFLLRRQRSTDLLERHEEVSTTTARETARQVLFLLRQQAGLSNSEIVEEIFGALKRDKVVHGLPPFVPGKAIQTWLAAVSMKVGPSKLLHLATVLRNRIVHSERPEWSIDKP